jgi:diguanylate cyclase (GGDEF)-like protein/PAS domain S-box-containing protein
VGDMRHLSENWQDMINLMGELIDVPVGLIMRLNHGELEVFTASNSDNNPYEIGERAIMENSGLYCETVIKQGGMLKVPNALTDDHWKNNPDVKLNMISYLGYPIHWPDRTIFGTICVLDNKENHYSVPHEELLLKFRDLIEMELALHKNNQQLEEKTQELQNSITIAERETKQRKQVEKQDKIKSVVLEQLISGEKLSDILTSIINYVEESSSFSLCSILLMDTGGKHLLIGAAPHLPEFYNEAINGIKIGAEVGSCGAAAFSKKRIVVGNIQTHPNWIHYKELAAKANLHSCWSEPILGAKKQVLGTFAIYHREPCIPKNDDITLIEMVSNLVALVLERTQANDQIQLLSRAYHQTHEGINITDASGVIVDVNPAFCEITGFSREEVIGQNPSILNSGKQSAKFYADMWQSLKEHGHWQGEVWNRKKDGSIFAELLTVSSLVDEQGNIQHYVGIFSDITQNKKQQEKLNLMAHYDVLTKLPNRTLFADRFHQAIAHSNRTKAQLAVCFLDLDNFKSINDNFGHEVGDQLLIKVAERITASIREEDTVSRQGGDEFAMLLNDIETYAQCEQTLERIHHSLAEPYLINGHTHKITASSGITLYPADDADIDTLLRHADQAMYQAKAVGKHCYHLFNAEHDQQVIRKHNQLKIIEFALANDEFELYYQPKVNMVTGEVFGAEALIRWNHPEKGLIPPLDFLPVIEGSELEIKVGNWVINRALQQLDTWQQQAITLEVSINISSHHLLSKPFFAELESALANHPEVNSNYLQLEILESSALSDLNAISSIIKTCQSALGVHVALDDFGTGYSSLTHLRNLPVNTIKIDQTFIRDMLDDPSDYAIIDGVIGLADSFNREVIAEGVETANHGLMLLLMGCEQAQGYGIAKPMPANDFAGWLTHYIPNQDWLRCGKEHHTIKESKVKLFKLIINQWKDKFITNIQSSPEDIKHWPIMDRKYCHCSDWLKRAQQTQLFEQKWLDNMEGFHEDLHTLADDLWRKYQQGDIDLARDGLTELHIVFDDINKLLELELFIPVVK